MYLSVLFLALLPGLIQADAQCELQTGTCKYTSAGCSGGQFWSGKCNGLTNRQCCIPGSQSGDTKCVQTEEGYCQMDSNSCSGSYISGKCAGATNRRCCVPTTNGQLSIGQVCESNANNNIRGCDSYGCGDYGASRGSSTHKGVDVICTEGDDVYAPFPGTLIRTANPYGHGKCCDTGLLFVGSGIWSDYEVKMFYISKLGSDGTTYAKGDVIATHAGLHCENGECYGSGMTDHTHFQLYKNGNIIDPTSML